MRVSIFQQGFSTKPSTLSSGPSSSAEGNAHSISACKRKLESNSERSAKAPRCLITIKRNNKFESANCLPKVLVLNPRSIYNKVTQLKCFMKEEDIDLCMISESWERPNEPLDTVIKIKNFCIISNPHQRAASISGGRPAIIANTEKFIVDSLPDRKNAIRSAGIAFTLTEYIFLSFST